MSLGDRMKEYESQSKTKLLRRTPVIIRLDGKAFHTFCRGLDKPFDRDFSDIMEQTMLSLCENIQGCVLGYTQSDEITLVLVDYKNRDSRAWFDNQVQKIVSISASMATLYFNFFLTDRLHSKFDSSDRIYKLIGKEFKATFDSRAFNVPQHEVINNLIWRQQDAIRNSVNALAQSLFSHRELQGINSRDVKKKMIDEKNVDWDELPTSLQRGVSCIKDESGNWFIDSDMPVLTKDRDYIDRLIYIGENNNEDNQK